MRVGQQTLSKLSSILPSVGGRRRGGGGGGSSSTSSSSTVPSSTHSHIHELQDCPYVCLSVCHPLHTRQTSKTITKGNNHDKQIQEHPTNPTIQENARNPKNIQENPRKPKNTKKSTNMQDICMDFLGNPRRSWGGQTISSSSSSSDYHYSTAATTTVYSCSGSTVGELNISCTFSS